MTNRIREITLLDAVTETGAADPIPTEQQKGWNFIFVASGVTTGATITIEVEYFTNNWVVIHTEEITATGDYMVQSEQGHYRRIRANVTSYTDGTYYVFAQGSWVY